MKYLTIILLCAITGLLANLKCDATISQDYAEKIYVQLKRIADLEEKQLQK